MMNGKEEWKIYLWLGLLTLLSISVYITTSAIMGAVGFPLDDAWIHQTFARNFAEHLSWSFQLGQPSGGSTGPLWGGLLSAVHFVGLPPVWGTFLFGFILLWACSIIGFNIGSVILTEEKSKPISIAVILIFEWHLVWAALSGMETLFLAMIALLVFRWLIIEDNRYWLAGLLIGLSIWIRPDGLTLAGPVLLAQALRPMNFKKKLNKLGHFSGSLLLVTGSYFLFNYFVAGDIWPNTFFAKQAEYEALRQVNYISRYSKVGLQVVTGLGAMLLPGFIYEGIDILKKKDWMRASMYAWVVGYVGIYAWRLPVVYQHGRYVMPAMPVFFILATAGMCRLLENGSRVVWKRVLNRTVFVSGALILIIFWGLGARAYALDVGVIETEMVEMARWVRANTPPDALIGAHDIGALGYYGEREIIDMAGLVTPDVIPFIRDEKKLKLYLDQNQIDYLVTFPGWYPELVQDLRLIYETDGRFVDIFGMENMAIYYWE